jgi:demethylmenaquinone methyltransferase/2-methoxy-6-polyprenyl-1,4-benzoquinol methylase
LKNPTDPVVRPESEIKIAAMFDKIAGRYDFLNGLLSARQDQRWRKRLIREVPYRADGTFLDVATGTGDVVLAAAAARNEYKHFEGVDISEKMLDLAAEKATAKNSSRTILFKKMSAEKLLYGDQTIDCVSISFGLRNVVNKEQAIAEFSRILKPGGHLLILEFFIPTNGFFGKLFQFYFHSVLPKIGGLFSSRDAYTYLPQSVASFYSPSELQKKLAGRGLTVLQSVSWLFGAVRLVHAEKSKAGI